MQDETKPEPASEPLATRDVEAGHDADAAVTHAVAEALPLVVELPQGEDEPLDEPPVPLPVHHLHAEAHEDLKPTLMLEKKHPLAIRWMHWINFPVLFTMIWSGILIYWNDSDNSYLYPHEVYRVGIGSFTLFRLFPAWFYTNHIGPESWGLSWDAKYHVTKALGYHFFFMWIFAANGILYVAYLLWSREWKFMVPTKESVREAIQVTLVDLHIRKGMPKQTKYNGAQRIAYSAIILMGFGSLVTGLSIYKPTEVHWITSLLGGYEMARWEHFWLTIGFSAFFLIHVAQVMMAGWNNFRAMVSGYELRPVEEPSIEAERRTF
jgi:thiosulfate reductase cytochrome b subunit